MSKLTIIANIKVNSDQVDFVRTKLLRLVVFSRAEKGCIDYVLHQDNKNSENFTFYETWESREAWVSHMQSEHLAVFRDATEDAIDDFNVSQLTVIE